MNIVESIKKAKGKGLSDSEILEIIERQNPEKKAFFNKAKRIGANATEILEEIISQNAPQKKPLERERFEEVYEEYSPPQEEEERKTPEKTPTEPIVQKEEKGFEQEMREMIKNEDPIYFDASEIPEKPVEEAKLWTRIYIALSFIVLLSLVFTFFYRSLTLPRVDTIEPRVITKEVYLPRSSPSLLTLYPERDSIERFPFSSNAEFLMHLENLLQKPREEDLVRIIVEDHTKEEARLLDMEDFFRMFSVSFPENFFEVMEKDLHLFLHPGEEENNLAFGVPFERGDREIVEWNVMRPWEGRIEERFLEFFQFLGEEIPETRDDLESVGYRTPRVSTIIRYREGTGEKGLYYAILNDCLFFATSMETMEKTIERYSSR